MTSACSDLTVDLTSSMAEGQLFELWFEDLLATLNSLEFALGAPLPPYATLRPTRVSHCACMNSSKSLTFIKDEDMSSGARLIAMFGKRRPGVSTREKRRAKRTSVNAPVVVETTAGTFHATIVNVSASGARLVTSEWSPRRQDVQIIVGGIHIFGRIAWCRDKIFAVKFEEGLHEHTSEEIYQAIVDASMPIYALDREAMLIDLVNKGLSGSNGLGK